MNLNDPLGDMLTRIRNGQSARKATTDVTCSKMHEAVLAVLKQEGYIADYKRIKRDKFDMLEVRLRYHNDQPVIRNIGRISKPGRRVYSSIADLTPASNGLGVKILSTSHGVMSDAKARSVNIGGEVLCEVF
ncbi:MAG: 30S ribosomal protein S8 [Pseudomonadota bacterium]